MADHVYLSLWLRGFTSSNMLRHFQKMLERFPFSRLRPGLLLRINAIEFSEPPVLEEHFEASATIAEVVAAARDFENPDCAYVVEANWDLWQFEDEWKLAPSPVLLTCFGPEFPSDNGESILFDLGLDSLYLPPADAPGGFRAVQFNIRSLLHLVSDLRQTLSIDHLSLWSESGVNLAGQLEEMVRE
jgi:hypothetical protein